MRGRSPHNQARHPPTPVADAHTLPHCPPPSAHAHAHARAHCNVVFPATSPPPPNAQGAASTAPTATGASPAWGWPSRRARCRAATSSSSRRRGRAASPGHSGACTQTQQGNGGIDNHHARCVHPTVDRQWGHRSSCQCVCVFKRTGALVPLAARVRAVRSPETALAPSIVLPSARVSKPHGRWRLGALVPWLRVRQVQRDGVAS